MRCCIHERRCIIQVAEVGVGVRTQEQLDHLLHLSAVCCWLVIAVLEAAGAARQMQRRTMGRPKRVNAHVWHSKEAPHQLRTQFSFMG